MVRRLLLATCVLVAVDLAILVAVSYWFGWRLPAGELVVTTVIGLAVVLQYQRQWAESVTNRLDSDYYRSLDATSLEKILLLAAGLILLVPGFLTDVIGLLLIVPWVRRQIVCKLRP